MYLNQKSGRCILLAGALVFSGCSSLSPGKQYVVPGSDEPAATIRLKAGQDTSLEAVTFNDKGCYAGHTTLPANGDYIESRVAVNKELVLTYRQNERRGICSIPFSFTPQNGATYTLTQGSWSETKAGVVPILDYEQHFCGVRVVKTIGDQETIEPIQKLRIRGLACLKFVDK